MSDLPQVIEEPAARRERAPHGARREQAAGGPAGLVHLETNDTWNPLSPKAQRWRRLSRMKRATVTSARLITQSLQVGGFRYRAAFITLTYATDGAWRPRHISDLVKHYRQWLQRRGHRLRVVWTSELTGRGRVHYHMCLWLPMGLTPPKPDKQGWWPHGMTQVQWVKRSAVAYIVKYATKCAQTGGEMAYLDENWQPYRFPKGCRIHGRSGLETAERRVVSWWCLPRYVREHFEEEGSWVTRAKGGGWVNRDSSEWLPSISFRAAAESLCGP